LGAVVLSGIAQIQQEQKNYEKALELYEESLLAGQAALGEYHSEIAMLLNRMGNFHFEQERLSDALKCYKKGLYIELKVLPPYHLNIVVTYSTWVRFIDNAVNGTRLPKCTAQL